MAEGAAAAVLGGLFGDKYVLILYRVDKLIKCSPYFQAGFGLMVHFARLLLPGKFTYLFLGCRSGPHCTQARLNARLDDSP